MKTKARLAWKSFDAPDKDIKFIGITGTDGKSTTSAMIYHILQQAGYKVGLISTVYIDVGEGKQDNKSHMTSLDHKLFWKYINQAKKNGLTHIVLEVSSHALYQYRTWPIRFEAAGCTNMSREHLDFHRTMDHYASSKGELFELIVPGGLGVLPRDFEYKTHFNNPKGINVTFGYSNDAQIWSDNIQEEPKLTFSMHLGQDSFEISTNLVGKFNVENMMHATLISEHVGVNPNDIVKALETFKGLPGRQELIETKQGITAMIDFAVTADGLATVYKACKSMGYNKVVAVFGATGNRDKGKRPEMGEVAAKYSDIAIITEDENYHEDGMEIMEEVEKGVRKSISQGVNQSNSNGFIYEMVQDRSLAIRRGLELANEGDVVVVTGMANYSTRSMNEGSVDWDEKRIILEQMKELGLNHIVN